MDVSTKCTDKMTEGITGLDWVRRRQSVGRTINRWRSRTYETCIPVAFLLSALVALFGASPSAGQSQREPSSTSVSVQQFSRQIREAQKPSREDSLIATLAVLGGVAPELTAYVLGEEKCLTRIVSEAQSTMRLKASLGLQQALSGPIVTQDSILSPSGRFMIHYDLTGPNAVESQRYADLVAVESDSAFDLEVTDLGYPAPPTLWDGRYHTYIISTVLQGIAAYGYTSGLAGGSLPKSPSGLNRDRAFNVISNSFSDPIFKTKGDAAVRITVFHEFFHVIQWGDFGHDNSNLSSQNDIWFQEMSSTWMETRCAPSVKDYLNYLPKYLHAVDLRFDRAEGYGQAIWWEYVTKQFGEEIVKTAWQRHADSSYDALIALESTFRGYGESFCSVYQGFGRSLLQTGRRYAGESVFHDARLFGVDTIPVTLGLPTVPMDVQCMPAALQIFQAGFGKDTCFVVLARDIDRLNQYYGTITITADQHYTEALEHPSSFCSGFVRSTSNMELGVFPQPFNPLDPQTPVLNILASKRAAPPVNLSLDIWTNDLFLLRHSSASALPFENEWYATWDGRDDNGRQVGNGTYIYRVSADGAVSRGKIMVVRN